MDTSTLPNGFLRRVKDSCPHVFDPKYFYDEPSGCMRRERFLYVFEYGHDLLSSAIDREGVQSAFMAGIEDSESIATTEGQDLCLAMCSRVFAGGLLYIMPYRHCCDGPDVKEKVADFLAHLVIFAELISVRCVVHLPVRESKYFESHPAFEEAARLARITKACFPMSSFGCRHQTVTTLWGTDKLVIKGAKHVSGRLLSMFTSVANRRTVGMPSATSWFGDQTNTYVYCVVDIVLLRHRHSPDSLITMDIPRKLDLLARDLLLQDLDEVFMVLRQDSHPYPNSRPRQRNWTLEVEDCFVTRPLGPTPLVSCACHIIRRRGPRLWTVSVRNGKFSSRRRDAGATDGWLCWVMCVRRECTSILI
eukprot:s1222_g5.t1